MAKKKIDTTQMIIDQYMKYVLENGENPKSIYAFSSQIGIKEADFYNSFGSLEAIEKNIFKAFLDNTLDVLNKNAEYEGFDAENKLLSFYYTFFEILKANRSYVVYALKNHKNGLKVLATLTSLRKSFNTYIDDLGIDMVDLKVEKLDKVKDQGLKEWTWAQLLFVLKFWLEDESAGFEKTDILIEKSVTTSFALMDNSTLKSLLDLGKFIWKEKMMTN